MALYRGDEDRHEDSHGTRADTVALYRGDERAEVADDVGVEEGAQHDHHHGHVLLVHGRRVHVAVADRRDRHHRPVPGARWGVFWGIEHDVRDRDISRHNITDVKPTTMMGCSALAGTWYCTRRIPGVPGSAKRWGV